MLLQWLDIFVSTCSDIQIYVCVAQNEESSDQPGVAEVCGRQIGGSLLLREGEAERSGLLLLHDGTLLHHSDGGVPRPDVSLFKSQ